MADFTIVVLPFLKTSKPVRVGGLDFRSTEDVDGLSDETAEAVNEVSRMLYAQEDFRIRAASYALIPVIDLDHPPLETSYLENIQAVIAYLYATPHEIFGNPFLHSENASLILFTPGTVLSRLTRPAAFNVIYEGSGTKSDENEQVRGYAALQNFRHHFWVKRGSRIYGPWPQPVFNISQDLYIDVGRASGQTTYAALFRLLERPSLPSAERVLTALRWYSSANREETNDDTAIVHLAIAFEALLGLPQGDKTDRIVDAISLLLGRVSRLDAWAEQFYDARSRIVHQGHGGDLRFSTGAKIQKQQLQLYQSLFSYGSQVFRLCLGTLLTGIELAEGAALAEKFITNQERFTELCKILGDSKASPQTRLTSALDLVGAIERYRFVGETGLQIDTMIGAVRLAAKTLIDSEIPVEPNVSVALDAVVNTRGDRMAELEALKTLADLLPDTKRPDAGLEGVVRRVVSVVWGILFMHYYWLKKQQAPVPPG